MYHVVQGCAEGYGRPYRALRFTNKLTALPASFGQLTALGDLQLVGNPLERPPLAVCQRGVKAIAQYFQEAPAASGPATSGASFRNPLST